MMTAAEIARILHTPPLPHQLEALDRLERAHQHAGALAVGFTRQIEAVRCAVYEVDVCAMRRPKQRCVARRLSNVGVTRGIARKVRFGFDDSSRDESVATLAN